MVAATDGGSSTAATFSRAAAVESDSAAPLTFAATPVSVGSSLSHQPGSSEILIAQPGVYHAYFHSTVSTQPGESIPAILTIDLALNGETIQGASATHTFVSSAETSTLSFTVPFQVTDTPSTLQAISYQTGFNFINCSLTVVRLGDATL